jgi:hypothetical protein
VNWFASIADEKIREAIRKGEFKNLPGAGKPLPPDDLAMVPEELRMAFKILKNAGALPEEMQLRKDMVTLGDLLAACRDESERTKLRKELSLKKVRYQSLMSDRGWHSSSAFSDYELQMQEKMTEE